MSEAITEIKESKTHQIAGVAGIIVLPSGEILAVQETTDGIKSGKKSGDWTIPMETVEANEGLDDTFERMLNEEVLTNGNAKDLVTYPKIWLGDYEVTPGIWARVFILFLDRDIRDLIGANALDVQCQSVVNPAWFLDVPIRSGVEEMIKDFLSNNREIIRPNALIKTPAHHI